MTEQSTLVPVAVIYRCGHESELMAYTAVADYLRASCRSWVCTPCRLRAPEFRGGRGRESSRVPLIRSL